jgi:hypothetical protein
LNTQERGGSLGVDKRRCGRKGTRGKVAILKPELLALQHSSPHNRISSNSISVILINGGFGDFAGYRVKKVEKCVIFLKSKYNDGLELIYSYLPY